MAKNTPKKCQPSIKNVFIIVLSFICFTVILSRNLIDDEETLQRRLSWIKQHETEATNGKVSFEYSSQTGFYCVNKEPTFKGEFVFSTKSDYVTCSCKLIISNF